MTLYWFLASCSLAEVDRSFSSAYCVMIRAIVVVRDFMSETKYSKSPTYAVNSFRRSPLKFKNRVSRTVLKYDVFLTYMFVSKDN
jgi:hypothetical protein